MTFFTDYDDHLRDLLQAGIADVALFEGPDSIVAAAEGTTLFLVFYV